jgi:hypothetical protein
MLGDILSKQLALDLGRSIANFDNFVLEQEFVLKSDIIKKSATIIKQIDKIHEKYAAEHRKPVIVKEEKKNPVKVENPESDNPGQRSVHKVKPKLSPNPKSKVLVIEESVEHLKSDEEVEFGIFKGSPNKPESFQEIEKVHREESKALSGQVQAQEQSEDESWKDL